MSTGAIIQVPLWDIRPSPENDKLYKPIDPRDPQMVELVESISADGILAPLVIDLDGWIISGHRRYAAARLAGLTEAPCIIEHIRREADIDAFVALLREHNIQRVKTLDEVMREEAVSFEPENCYADLIERRRVKVTNATSRTSSMDLGKHKRRAAISDGSADMVRAVLRVIEDLKEFWPVSLRSVHYPLLNDPPLRHTNRRIRYSNDRGSYDALSKLLLRLRINGVVPWAAIHDETRIVETWHPDANSAAFIHRELDWLFDGYRRDLLQSQPVHIELIVEKKTLKPMVLPVTEEFTMPTVFAGGKCSAPPIYELAQRFKKSGKDHLRLLIVSDHDPDGDVIAQSFPRSLRDDHDIPNISAVKVGLTKDQAATFKLPVDAEAKVKSSTYKAWTAINGLSVWEVEALEPKVLQKIVRDAIISNLDTAAYNRELAAYKDDIAKLATYRAAVQKFILEGSTA